MNTLSVLGVYALIILCVYAAPQEDLITSLPGQPEVSFKQYAGYVTIDSNSSKALFYYFVEAEKDPEEKPLSLWLNGGPGCSSLGGGAFTELGPFYPDPQSNGLIRNSKAWNKVSNILFVDSPIGVGWSYSNTSSDYNAYDDEKTSKDLVKFLRGWFKKFPEYAGRTFYITGESYAGHYVPQLAARLLNYNKKHKSHFNLKGIAIGNPALSNTIDDQATFDYYWSHGLISDSTYQGISDTCNWIDYDNRKATANCTAYLAVANIEVGNNVDPYDVLLDSCLPEAVDQERRLQKLKATHKVQRSVGVDVCISQERTKYFRRPEVQQALHANTTGLPYAWTNCGGPLMYNDSNIDIDMVPVLEDLLKRGIRIFIYSGDADSVVPFLGTRTILNGIISRLKLETKYSYSAWYSHKQVAGWMQVNGNLTFATVKGAGHMVPYAQPTRALTMFSAFVGDKPLP